MNINEQEITCKCCGQRARWCDSRDHSQEGDHECAHIKCDHCHFMFAFTPGDYYDSPEWFNAETIEEAKVVAYNAYNNTLSNSVLH